MRTRHRPLRTLAASTFLFLGIAACAPDASITAPLNDVAHRAVYGTPTVLVLNTNDDGPGSLRVAVENAQMGGGIVGFDPSVTGPIALVAPIFVGGTVTVVGPAGHITVSGSNTTRLFICDLGGTLTLAHLRLTAAKSLGEGGAVLNLGTVTLDDVLMEDNHALGYGGAITNRGTMFMMHSRMTQNSANQAGGLWNDVNGTATIVNSSIERNTGAGAIGGIRNDGILTIERSTIAMNTSPGPVGGIFSENVLDVTNSTISGNTGSRGAGIFLLGRNRFVHVSIVGNMSPTSSAIHFPDATLVRLTNAIIAGNGASLSACGAGTLEFVGINLVDDASCAVAGPTVITGPAMLGPLAANGGMGMTHALLAGSAAIDAVVDCTLATDQRNVVRPQGPACDIGAFEFNDYNVATLTVDPSGTVNIATGVAYVTGRVACTKPGIITLQVEGEQAQKSGRINTTVSASTSVPVMCGSSQAWAAALAPATGAFSNAPMKVTVSTSTLNNSTAPAQATNPSVKISWTKK